MKTEQMSADLKDVLARLSSKYAGEVQRAERLLRKQDDAGSTPVPGSKQRRPR